MLSENQDVDDKVEFLVPEFPEFLEVPLQGPKCKCTRSCYDMPQFMEKTNKLRSDIIETDELRMLVVCLLQCHA